MSPQRYQLPNQQEHFSWGPIDLIIKAETEFIDNKNLIANAHDAAWERFKSVLPELTQELSVLKQPVHNSQFNPFNGRIAKKMWQSCRPFLPRFITPMAAVAGAVADDVIQYYQIPGIQKAWVNNGGDIALHLATNQSIPVGICSEAYQAYDKLHHQGSFTLDGQMIISAENPVRGIATSGWQGRSFSLGIADSVTVLAHNAAAADAAATIIGNAVNVEDHRILRKRANDIVDDSDLGDQLVTINVPTLEDEIVKKALENGLLIAKQLKEHGLIWGAILCCQQQVAYVLENTYSPSFKELEVM
jgi:uncharacterized protein